MNINFRIKELRQSLGLKQKQFADEIGLKDNTISLYENGKRCPSVRTLDDICYKFNVNPSWLKNGNGEMFCENPSDDQLAYLCGQLCSSDNEILKRTFFKVCKLNDKYLNMFEKMLDTLLEEE